MNGGVFLNAFHGERGRPDLADFTREMTRNADALALSDNGMYPCRLSEPYLSPIPFFWHVSIGMDGREEAKHWLVACLSHGLLINISDDASEMNFWFIWCS